MSDSIESRLKEVRQACVDLNAIEVRLSLAAQGVSALEGDEARQYAERAQAIIDRISAALNGTDD